MQTEKDHSKQKRLCQPFDRLTVDPELVEGSRTGVLLVRAEGVEPPTSWFEARRSIQLSYARAFPEDTQNLDASQYSWHTFVAVISVVF